MDRIPVVVLASGTGTLFQSLIDATAAGGHPIRVVGLLTDRPGCGAAERAAAAGVPVVGLDPGAAPSRADWDADMAAAAAEFAPEWLVSLGFMRLLGPVFLESFPGRIVNSHPSLLPAFPGAHAVRDALDYGVRVSGCTVHLVDSGVDTGPVLAQQAVPIADDDTEATLHERIKTVERTLIVEVLTRLGTHGYTLTGRKATLL